MAIEEDARVCERDGCTNSLLGYSARARFCSDVCRAAAWKTVQGYGRRQRPRRNRTNGREATIRTVTVSPAAHARIKGHAREQGMTVRELVERATDDYINRHFE